MLQYLDIECAEASHVWGLTDTSRSRLKETPNSRSPNLSHKTLTLQSSSGGVTKVTTTTTVIVTQKRNVAKYMSHNLKSAAMVYMYLMYKYVLVNRNKKKVVKSQH
ncbi:hypothetical protein E2C01_036168 [Portunus trituberculatus]|uniref:Uncharacterized protein n=1 Tax=Portunus trituberculatus TaxID=210409 RepID=A0A5B7FAL2_PORTR|nr:hypothetical protein [Portunus trituberculatus]